MHARPLQIGPVRLATNLLLAPIAGYCDLAFRVTVRSITPPGSPPGVGLACTDLLSPQGLLRGTATSLDLARTNDLDKPICMQLYGGDASALAEGARWAVRHGATVVDINMGCPVDKITKKDGGSKLLCDPGRTLDLARRVRDAVDDESRGAVPTTAKMRLGWDWPDPAATPENADHSGDAAPALASSLARAGFAAITVHGRYALQKFTGPVYRRGIARVVEAVRAAVPGVPVIANGDVQSPRDVAEMLRETEADGVMIGRAAFSAPWIFRDAWALLTAGVEPPEPTLEEKVAIVRRYFGLMLEYRDERYAMNHIRRRITWFAKRLGPCKPLKEAVRTAASPADVHAALDAFLAGGLRRWEGGLDAEECDGPLLAA